MDTSWYVPQPHGVSTDLSLHCGRGTGPPAHWAGKVRVVAAPALNPPHWLNTLSRTAVEGPGPEGGQDSRNSAKYSSAVISRPTMPSSCACRQKISIVLRFFSKPYGWKSAPITASVSSSSASNQGDA
jgi:hypothetical protein